MSNVCVKNCCIGSGIPKICVPIVATNLREIFSQARGMQRKNFDLIEWRIDRFADFHDINMVRRASRILHGILDDQPFILTFRTIGEGGKQPIEPEYYVELYRTAIEEHLVDMIDVELFIGDEIVKELTDLAHSHGMPVIISNHDFDRTPPHEELIARMKHAESVGADILKIAVMPKDKHDVLGAAVRHGADVARKRLPAHHHVHGSERHHQPSERRNFRQRCDLRYDWRSFCTGTD